MGIYKLDISNRSCASEMSSMGSLSFEQAPPSDVTTKQETSAEKPDIQEDICACYERLYTMLKKAGMSSAEMPLVQRLQIAQEVRWEAGQLRRRIPVTGSNPTGDEVDLLQAYADVKVRSIVNEHRVPPRRGTIGAANTSFALSDQMMAQAKIGSSGVSDFNATYQRSPSLKDQWMAEFKASVANDVRGMIAKEITVVHAALGILQQRMDVLEVDLGATTRSLDSHVALSTELFQSSKDSRKNDKEWHDYDIASLWTSVSNLDQRIDILKSNVLTRTFDGGINHFNFYPLPKDYYEEPYYEEPDAYYEERETYYHGTEADYDPGWPSEDAWGDDFAQEAACEEVDSGSESIEEVSEDRSGLKLSDGKQMDDDDDSGQFELGSPASVQSSISVEDTVEQHQESNEKGDGTVMTTTIVNVARSNEYISEDSSEEDDVFLPAEEDSQAETTDVVMEKVGSCDSVGIQTDCAESGDGGADKGRSCSGLVCLILLLVMIWMALTVHEVNLKVSVMTSVTGVSDAGGLGCFARAGCGVERGLTGF